MAGWLHGVSVGEWLFVCPLCGFSLSLFCNYVHVIGAHRLRTQHGGPLPVMDDYNALG